HYAVVGPPRVTTIFNQAGLRVGLFPEVKEVGVLDLSQELVVVRGKSGSTRGQSWPGMLTGGGGQRAGDPVCCEGQARGGAGEGNLSQDLPPRERSEAWFFLVHCANFR